MRTRCRSKSQARNVSGFASGSGFADCPPWCMYWYRYSTPAKTYTAFSRFALVTGLTLHTMYCNEISPRYKFQAVELTTKPLEIDCGGGVVIRLTGQLDRARICKTGTGVGIADVKTGGASVSQGVAKTKGHAPQIGTYEILYEHTTGEPITAPAHIIGLKTKGKAEAGIGEIRGAKQMMVGTEEFPGLIQIGAEMLRTGLFPPNPQSFTCSAKYCTRWSTCPYHE